MFSWSRLPWCYGRGPGIGEHKLVDTASFTLELLERISGKTIDEPFALAIAGYGTGKSHLGVTLASLLGNPWICSSPRYYK